MSSDAIGEVAIEAAASVPARSLRTPAFLSEGARQFLVQQPEPTTLPAPADKAAWRAHIAAMDQAVLPLLTQICAAIPAETTEIQFGDVRVFDVVPAGVSRDSRGVILDMHGGGLIMCGGELCRMMAIGLASRLQRRIWSIDYRMPPEHPYPAALDDCIAAYRALLAQRSPAEIIVHGGSAGGNLAAATILRARDEGLPLPAGAILNTPEADLTESGDSFQTNFGVDPGLRPLMPANLLYADGHPLDHPYLSPLFGSFSQGFPPTLLTSGTRDLYLSNTVRMHRALRAADVPAALHLTEAGPHTGFPGTPEGEQIDRELRNFILSFWPSK